MRLSGKAERLDVKSLFCLGGSGHHGQYEVLTTDFKNRK